MALCIHADLQEKKSIKHQQKIKKLKEISVESLTKVEPPLKYFATDTTLSIGKGSNGTFVFVGIMEDGSEVAVKRMLICSCEAPAENEKKILSLIDTKKSPFIVRYRHFFKDSTFIYLAVDLCEETLKEHVSIKSTEYLQQHGQRMIKEIFTGLDFLHKQGVLHRDLKPSNVLVDVDGHMRLADFGISRVLNEDETTHLTDAKGTRGWMAREVIETIHKGGKVHFKKKSDVQVGGMIAHFILTKCGHPFGYTYDRMSNIVKGDPVHLHKIEDRDDRSFVSWLISHNIDDRPFADEALETLESRENAPGGGGQMLVRTEKSSSASSRMNSSKEHKNWITVGEVINLIKKPVALYTAHILKRWHVTLCKDCLPFGQCQNPGNCQMEKKPDDLCPACNGWYKELAKSHINKDKRKIEWRKNCDTSKLPVHSWEVAKFFMPALGDNKSTVTEAECTDLSHLLNVLAWMKDVAFVPDRRVNLDLVRKLRTEVRNPWAHAPNQELTDADLINAFDTANKFAADLDIVFSSCDEVKKCIEDIKLVQTNGISNVIEAELKVLNSFRSVLGADISQLKER